MPIENNDMENFLKNISCGIRITEHDGNPMSLAEYNAAGRYFLFNKKMPFTFYVKERDSEKISEALLDIKKKAITPNAGSNFYLERHDKNNFIKNINKLFGI